MSRRTTRRRWRRRSRLDAGHGIRMAIGDLARAAAAPGWSRLVVRHAQVGAHASTTVTRDGHEITVEGVEEPFRRLRELSYMPGVGTWFTCELAFSPHSRGYTGRVDCSARPFEDVPPVAALMELTTFPREEPPDWLLAALPTAAPLGLPTTNSKDRRDDHPDGHRPPPPITGELAYHPATTMTARDFDHSHNDGRHRICLAAEHAEDAEVERLAVACYQESYWMTRSGVHGIGGTDDGVCSITLDGATLRVELTPEAADAMETETTFEVHLDLLPDALNALRTTLPGMLRSVTDAPKLIGF